MRFWITCIKLLLENKFGFENRNPMFPPLSHPIFCSPPLIAPCWGWLGSFTSPQMHTYYCCWIVHAVSDWPSGAASRQNMRKGTHFCVKTLLGVEKARIIFYYFIPEEVCFRIAAQVATVLREEHSIFSQTTYLRYGDNSERYLTKKVLLYCENTRYFSKRYSWVFSILQRRAAE